MSITRGFTYTVVDHGGRPCYHVPESRVQIEFELAHLGKSHRLMVDVPDNDGDEVSYAVRGLLPPLPHTQLPDQVVIDTSYGLDSLACATLTWRDARRYNRAKPAVLEAMRNLH